MSKLKKIPKFKSEDAEREFWATHDSADHLDWSRAQPARFPALPKDKVTIPVQIPRATFDKMQREARRTGVSMLQLASRALRERLNTLFR